MFLLDPHPKGEWALIVGADRVSKAGSFWGGVRLGVVSQSQRKEEAEVTDSIRVTLRARFPER